MCQYEKRKCRYRKHTLIFNGKGGDFKKGALDSDFMFVNIEPYKSKKCVPY